MPIYEYECVDCGKQFEAFQRISDKPLKSCQFCQGHVHRLISRSSFSLKGGGWYQDGYSKSPPAEAKKAEKDPGAAPANDKTAQPKAAEAQAAKKDGQKEQKKKNKKAS
jgi:putative FmdB family regulatory protein